MKQLENKIVIVTGGSGLLGKSIVQLLEERGATVINFDLNNPEDSKYFVACDIREETSIEKAISSVIENFGRIDGLVNNAYPRTSDWGNSFENTSTESWKTNIDWQLNSYALITQKVIPYMREKSKGSIIFMTSIYGIVGNDMTIYEDTNINAVATYSAIKGGLISFSKFLASLYGKENIRVNCVSPGGIFDHQDPKFVSAYEHKVPMKRMGNPDDISPAVAFLLSDDSKYITGHNLVVDGGWTAI